MCCARLAGNAGPKKLAKNRHLDTIAQLCRAISSQLGHVLTIEENSLNSNISPTCPYNMVNFCLLAAEIVSLVWGILANFNGFCVLAALLHSTLVLGVSQTSRVEHTAPPIFSRAAITLGSGPHSSLLIKFCW